MYEKHGRVTGGGWFQLNDSHELKGILASALNSYVETRLQRNLCAKHSVSELLLLFRRSQRGQELVIRLVLRIRSKQWPRIDLNLNLCRADRACEHLTSRRCVPLPPLGIKGVQLVDSGLSEA